MPLELNRQELTPPQRFVIEAGLLTSGFNCVLQMPTGSGKTWLAEQAIAQTLETGRRALYLSPLRALAAQLHQKWGNRFGQESVGVFTGDSASASAKDYSNARLLVMTPERLDACTRSWRTHWRWIPEVDLLVVDELHLLGDRGRGPRLEGTISRFRRLNPFARIIGLSATLGNRAELARWLDGVHFESTWRPIPLTWRIVPFRKATEKPDLVRDLTGAMSQQGGRSLVFVQSRRRAEQLAEHLRASGLAAAHHHAGLDQHARQSVEAMLSTGELHVVVATSTVEMGVNLPVRQVVLYDLQTFDGSDFRPLSVNSVWQRVGRAGRPGLDAAGEGVLLCPSWDRSAVTYRSAPFDPVVSRLGDPAPLAEQVVAEVGSGLARTRGQLRRVLSASLGGLQGRVASRVDPIVDEMLSAGMLREDAACEENGKARVERAIAVTRLGRIAVRHLLAPETIVRLRTVLEYPIELSFFDLLLAVCCTPDAEPVLPVGYEELESLREQLVIERSTLLSIPAQKLFPLLGTSGKRLLSALRMARALRDWTRTGEASDVAEHHDCYPFEVQRLVENTTRLLQAFVEVARALDSAQESPEANGGATGAAPAGLDEVPSTVERIEALRHMVSAGMDDAAASLTSIPGIGPSMARRLVAAGVADIEDLANSEVVELVPRLKGVSRERLGRWISMSSDNLKLVSAFRYREVVAPANVTAVAPLPSGVDPYRLLRARELTVLQREDGAYQVTGGLEPHLLSRVGGILACDCADAARGNICKHVLAIRLQERDPELAVVFQQHPHEERSALNLSALWSGGFAPLERRTA